MKNKNHLVILSIPFSRINKVLLSPLIRETLQKKANLLIISPFAENKEFQNEFGFSNIYFFKIKTLKNMSHIFRTLYLCSEIMRTHGYWTRFRNNGMSYFFVNRFVNPGPNGEDRKFSIIKRFIYGILGLLGAWEKSWELIDKIIGPFIFKNYKLIKICQKYKKITLIQSASWGMQDRALGWISRKNKWRKVLIPYTTDQLYCNGYLISDFDIVCVQGTCEFDFAIKYHNLSRNRIKKLGSAWARYIEVLQKRVKNKNTVIKRKKIIGYAGVSSIYFPSKSELFGLEILLEAINQGKIEEAELVYRPLVQQKEIDKKFKNKSLDLSNLSIQTSQKACFGMEDYDDSIGYEESLEEFIDQISKYDLLVMAGFTSLSIELAYIGIPSISYFFDPTGVLIQRKIENILNENNREMNFPEIPLILNSDQLIPEVNKLLNNPREARTQAGKTALRWDYKKVNLQKVLNQAIFGL